MTHVILFYFLADEKTAVFLTSERHAVGKKWRNALRYRESKQHARARTMMRSSQKRRGRLFEKALKEASSLCLFLPRREENTFQRRRRRRDIFSSSITPRADDFTRHHRNAPFSPRGERTRTTPKQTTQQSALNYKNVLLVLKETALLKYTSLVGAAETNERCGDSYENVVRWDRLKARHETHEKAVLKGTRLQLFFLSRVFLLFLFLLQRH